MTEKTLKHLFGGWYSDLQPLLESNYFDKLATFLNTEYSKYRQVMYPPDKKDIFNVFQKTDLSKVRVVIIGTEPDSTSGDLAFSVSEESVRIGQKSSSIRDCIERQFADGLLLDFDFTLDKWAEQGVLLLNRALTAQYDKVGGHVIYWTKFTEYIIKMLNMRKTGLIFVLWGADAQRFKILINEKSHYILEGEDISSAVSKKLVWKSTHFKDINNIIEGQNGKEAIITWHK